jgi:hypothetical protein
MGSGGGGGGGGGFDALVPAYVEGAGEALRAAYAIKPGTRLLRVAPVVGIPYAAELGVVCGGCFQSCDASCVCPRCNIARLCKRCAAGPAQATHDDECYALQRLAAGKGLHSLNSQLNLRTFGTYRSR